MDLEGALDEMPRHSRIEHDVGASDRFGILHESGVDNAVVVMILLAQLVQLKGADTQLGGEFTLDPSRVKHFESVLVFQAFTQFGFAAEHLS